MSTEQPKHDPNDPILEPSLRELDARIGRLAARSNRRAPADLEQRVFAASVKLLPKPLEPARVERRVAGRIGPDRLQWNRLVWGRLAMAASVGLVFVVVAFFLNRPIPDGSSSGAGLVLASDVEWLGSEPLEEERRVAFLLDTGDLSSFTEVAFEIESMIADFEM